MSLLGYKKQVEEGDLVIVFIGHESMVAITIKKGEVTQTKYGALRHNDIIGKKYGSKIQTVNQRGYVYILHPTPELWTVNLPHRTQILYFADISMITMQLELKPGSLVVESGTGSGSMSHAMARTIAPNGHLYTFEFHEQRAQMARAEFKSHGLAHIITVEHRDVCETGFGLELKVDAVFLDLPSPHLAVAHAKKVLKPGGGRICSFSPCIEQVQRTCQEFQKQGFSDMTTMECLLRNYDTRTVGFPVPNLGLEELTEEKPSNSNQSVKLCSNHRNVDVSKLGSVNSSLEGSSTNSECKDGLTTASTKGNVSKEKQETIGDVPRTDSEVEESKMPAAPEKRIKKDELQEGNIPEVNQEAVSDSLGTDRDVDDTKKATTKGKIVTEEEVCEGGESSNIKKFKRDDVRRGRKAKATSGQYTVKCAVPNKQTAGHTGYLTFATLFNQPE